MWMDDKTEKRAKEKKKRKKNSTYRFGRSCFISDDLSPGITAVLAVGNNLDDGFAIGVQTTHVFLAGREATRSTELRVQASAHTAVVVGLASRLDGSRVHAGQDQVETLSHLIGKVRLTIATNSSDTIAGPSHFDVRGGSALATIFTVGILDTVGGDHVIIAQLTRRIRHIRDALRTAHNASRVGIAGSGNFGQVVLVIRQLVALGHLVVKAVNVLATSGAGIS